MVSITIHAGEHKELKDRQGISYYVIYNDEKIGEWVDNVVKYAAQRLLEFYGLDPNEQLYIYNFKSQLIFRNKPIKEFAEEDRKEFEFGQSSKIIRSKKQK